MAGYSGTPLPRKLGIKEGHRVALLQAPPGLDAAMGPLPEGVSPTARLGAKPFDVIVLFVRSRAELATKLEPAARRLDAAGGLWVSWPKKASKLAGDLSEDWIRNAALALGLVDNKVCAIDEDWSGLRCVVRLKDRGNWPPAAATSRRRTAR